MSKQERLEKELAKQGVKLHHVGSVIVAQCATCGESWIPDVIVGGRKPDASKCPTCPDSETRP